MRTVISFLMFFMVAKATGQNVGVGTATPSEKLDVNGNVNIQGNLKVNGDAGRPGQVLQMSNNGTQIWANTFGYKNRKVFTFPGITTWTVPAGISEIMIECVGGGGGGSTGGGGGAGAYSIAVVKVAPGSVVTVNVGNFGAGATSGGAPGGFGAGSLATGTDFTVTANGGSGGTAGYSGSGGDGVANGDSVIYSRIYAGNNGSPTVEEYTQLDATTYITIRKYGNGGVCPYDPFVISAGGFYSFNSTTNATYRLFSGYPLGAGARGYGGAGNLESTFTFFGINGGGGLVAISW